ncbi:hypothetical protein DY000_02019833 [Brassica cretica]|uniref:Uncharacterized protein n=1 Tax=Brassica cretica TaxID=69181 RepID=A0ABQ7CRQ0_BRACR|nr:hypothetical protein DY000_02019833 [Brassica cretica]
MEGKATEVEKQNLENILKMAEKLNESSEEGNETVESQTEEEQGDKSLVQENVQDQVVVGVDEAKVLENGLSDTVSETAVVLQEDIKDQGENKWLDVSPAKASRSSATRSNVLDVAQDSLLTNSRFSVLSAEEEGEITDREGENSDLHTEDVKTSEGVEIKEKEATAQRQSLPRDSKLKHKYLGDIFQIFSQRWLPPLPPFLPRHRSTISAWADLLSSSWLASCVFGTPETLRSKVNSHSVLIAPNVEGYLSLLDEAAARFKGLLNSGETTNSVMVITSLNPQKRR